MNAKSLWNIFPLIFLLILPALGKTIDYQESLFFFGLPILIYITQVYRKKTPNLINNKLIIAQIILIVFALISTTKSINIGISYYQFFSLINIFFIVNITLLLIPPSKLEIGVIIFSVIYSIIFIINKIGFVSLPIKNNQDNFILQIWGHSYLSDFIVLSIPIIISKIKSNKKTYLPILVLTIIGLIMTNSRSSILALLIGLFLIKKPTILAKCIFTFCIICLITIFVYTLYKPTNIKSFTGSRLEYWKEAIRGFKQSPLFGNGPGTFEEINNKYRSVPGETAKLAHNSILTFLSDNGIIFTAILLYLLYKGLILQKNHLFQTLITISFVNSLTDPSWSNTGIFIITLYMFFQPFLIPYPPNIKQQSNHKFLNSICLILLIFYFSKTSSDFLFLAGKDKISLKLDPFNINALYGILETIDSNQPEYQQYLSYALKISNQDYKLNQILIKTSNYPQKETYLIKSIELNPLESEKAFITLLDYYSPNQPNQIIKLSQLFTKIYSPINPNQLNTDQISLISYHFSKSFYPQNPQKSLEYIKMATELTPGLSYYHIELANLYYQLNQQKNYILQLNTICQQTTSSKEHCNQYYLLHQNNPLPPFLDETSKAINEQYSHLLR